MKKLAIKSPCQENWNEFTPKPEGGFCGSCQKTVYRFYNKSNQEITEILAEKAGQNLCGRIATNQIQDFNKTYTTWHNSTSSQATQSRFVWALVLAFGISLFNIQNAQAQHLLGKIAYTEQVDTSKQSEENMIIENVPVDSNYTQDFIMGDIAIEPPVESDTLKKVSVKKTCKPIPPTPIKKLQHPIIMGMMVIPEPKIKKEPTIVKPQKPITIEHSIGHVSPNPANNATTLYLNIPKTDYYTISIYNNQGKLCKVILRENLTKGTHKLPIKLNEYETGSYHIKINNKDEQYNIQLIKN